MSQKTPRFRAATAALAGILIAIGGCSETPSSPAQPGFLRRAAHPSFDITGTSSAVIDGRGGTVQSAAGDKIVFPAGALSQPTTVTLTSDGTYVGVELQPHGITFPAGLEPQLILNAGATVPGGAEIVYLNEAGSISEELSTSVSGGKLRASLHHFSKYIALGG